MYNILRSVKFIRRNGRSILFYQNYKYSTGNNTKIILRNKTPNLQRFSLDIDSDSFLVNPSRLTSSEYLYQYLSSGASILFILLFIPFPFALFLYLTSKYKNLSLNFNEVNKTQSPNSKTLFFNSKVKVINNSKSLLNLLDTKKPVIIYYFSQNNENSLQINIIKSVLSQIYTLLSDELDIVFVDINRFEGNINPLLKSELTKSSNNLFHLLIPSDTEPLLTTLNPITSISSFLHTVKDILQSTPYKLKSSSKPNDSNGLIEELDDDLGKLRNCLFELTLEKKDQNSLISQNDIKSMLKQCNTILM